MALRHITRSIRPYTNDSRKKLKHDRVQVRGHRHKARPDITSTNLRIPIRSVRCTSNHTFKTHTNHNQRNRRQFRQLNQHLSTTSQYISMIRRYTKIHHRRVRNLNHISTKSTAGNRRHIPQPSIPHHISHLLGTNVNKLSIEVNRRVRLITHCSRQLHSAFKHANNHGPNVNSSRSPIITARHVERIISDTTTMSGYQHNMHRRQLHTIKSQRKSNRQRRYAHYPATRSSP